MKIVKAKLCKRETDDKTMKVNANIPDDREFIVDLDAKVRVQLVRKSDNTTHTQDMVRIVNGGFLPLELLEVGQEITLADFIKDVITDRMLETMDPNKMNQA